MRPTYEENWEVPPDVQRRFEQLCSENGWTLAEVTTHLMLYAIKEDINLAERLHIQRGNRKRDPKWYETYSWFGSS